MTPASSPLLMGTIVARLWVGIIRVRCFMLPVGGIAMGLSAWFQGKAGAGACDAFAETGKGFTNYLMALGIIETVAIFVMAFAIVLLVSVGA